MMRGCLVVLWLLVLLACENYEPYIIIDYTVSKGSRESVVEVQSFLKRPDLVKRPIFMNDVVVEIFENQVRVIHKDTEVLIPIYERPIRLVSIERNYYVDVDQPFFGASKRTPTGNVKKLFIKVVLADSE